MKKNYFIVAFFVFMFMPLLVSCFSKSGSFELEEEGDVEIIVGIDTTGIPVQEIQSVVDNTLAILATRLSQMDYDRYFVQQVDGQASLMVRVKGVTDRAQLRKALVSQANLGFWETFTSAEIIPYLRTLDSLYSANHQNVDEVPDQPVDDGSLESRINNKIWEEEFASRQSDHQLMEKLLVYYDTFGCIGRSKLSDVHKVDSILQSDEAKQCLPQNLKLLWGAIPVSGYQDEGEYLELYAIKVTDPSGQAVVTGDCVVKAESESTDWGPCISIEMNSDGARRWATMTKINIGSAIAIVVDDLVYSAPRVNGEITGGKSQISGSFTIEETKSLAAILNSGRMPVRLFLTSERSFEPSK